MSRRMVVNWMFVAIFVAFGGQEFAQGSLPTQTLNLSVQNPVPTANLSVGSLAGAIYRSDFNTWSLYITNTPITINLTLPAQMSVALTFSAAAALVQGQPNSPITITVNGNTLVTGYADTDAGWHLVPWKIPASMFKSGVDQTNEISVKLVQQAGNQYFIRGVTVSSFAEPLNFVSSNGNLYKKHIRPVCVGQHHRRGRH